MIIKLTQIPGATQEFGLPDNATVANLLDAANKDAANYAIRVNGTPVNTDHVLSDGDTVLLSKNAVGNK